MPPTSKPVQRPSAAAPRKEPWPEQAASFIGFFVYLLVLKSFFLPLFIIPTGSEAETLAGQHALHTCPSCGVEYQVGLDPQELLFIACPNCHWREYVAPDSVLVAKGLPTPKPVERLASPLTSAAGDRIFVHGWDYGPPFEGWLTTGPQRWDIVVFKVPSDGQTNYIKRLIGLRNETIELLDGDVFANGVIQRKPASPQRSLWFNVFDADYPPRAAPLNERYWPKWVAAPGEVSWTGLDSRVFRFDGTAGGRNEIAFSTDPVDRSSPPQITDFYGYNRDYQYAFARRLVTDTRVSGEVTFDGGDGCFELSTTKYDDRFFARLYASGDLKLEHERLQGEAPTRETWAEARVDATRPLHIALACADYRVSIEVNGQTVLTSTDAQYNVTPELARHRAGLHSPSSIRLAADHVKLEARHVRVERDVYYAGESERRGSGNERPANGGTGNPIQLGPNAYFCCGDNSPNSLDGRFWYPESVGPHLRPAMERGEYTAGTVPADQMIGRAFFVYWPGFMPLGPARIPILPDLGRVRWIR